MQLEHETLRVVIRSMRIAIGVMVATLGTYPISSGWGDLSIPFASSSLATILVGLLYIFAGLVIFSIAWSTAFGTGPERDT